MALEIALILDPLEDLKTHKDSSVAMMEAAYGRGHGVWVTEARHLALGAEGVTAWGHPLALTPTGSGAWYRRGTAEQRRLASFDAVLMRKDPPFDMEYVFITYLLELAEREGARVFNRAGAIRDYNEKLSTARFPQFTPPTTVTSQDGILRDFLAEHGDIIVKPLDGMGGSSIFRVRAGDPNVSVILETMTHLGTRTVMAQRYLPAIRDGDKRILLVDGVPQAYCLARVPQAGETRGNLAAGGTGVARPLTPRDREIGETLGPVLRDDGLLLVGLDVIGDHLTEINVTSPTCMREIHDQTGLDIAAAVIDALEVRCAAPR